MSEEFVTFECKDAVDRQQAAEILKVSTATIDRLRIPWESEPTPFRIRFIYDVAKKPWFYRPDVVRLWPTDAKPDLPRKKGRPRKYFPKRGLLSPPERRQNLLSI